MTRYSVDQTDPGYNAWVALPPEKRRALRITLNGIPQKFVTMADDVRGELRRLRLTTSGSMVIIGRDETEYCHGVVRFLE